MTPLAVDLCCGNGTWTNGFLARGYHVVGVDIERQASFGGEFLGRDVRDLDGGRFSGAAIMVASPPCEEFSRHAMPWTRKRNPPAPDLSIVEACWRLAHEARAPLILENVRAAQSWLGIAKAHLGPVYLWGAVPALLPTWWTKRHKEHYSSTQRIARASIPPELSAWIADCFWPDEA